MNRTKQFVGEADAPWSYGSYYLVPNRNWAFDPDLLDPNNLPPGTPQVNIVIRTSWKQSVLSDFSLFQGHGEIQE